MRQVTFTLNGQDRVANLRGAETLLEVLRDQFALLGTKANCLEAECGVCTVVLDGAAVASCILLAHQCHGKHILTVEGLSRRDGLHPLQDAFVRHGAVQCGYCIPGMLLTAYGLLKERPNPDEVEVREGISGTLCRCTGYQKIVDAILDVAKSGEAI